MAALLVVLFGASLVAAWAFKPPPAPRYRALRSRDIPCSVAGFATCVNVPIDSATREILSSGDIIDREYGQDSDAINFLCIGGESRNSMHDPRLCLSGVGKTFTDDHTEILPGTGVSARVYRVVSTQDRNCIEVMYFYYDDGTMRNEYADVRRSMLWSELTGRRLAPFFFFRFIRVVGPDPSADTRDHLRMERLAASIWLGVAPKLKSLADAAT